jgi:hypothetical protein
MTCETQNPVFGFFGTMGCIGQDARAAWAIAMPLIKAATAASAEGVRAFLDSRDGRHFADEVSNHLARGLTLDPAIRAAVDVYQCWRITRAIYRSHGIPEGLPYLTGWVGHYEGVEEV